MCPATSAEIPAQGAPLEGRALPPETGQLPAQRQDQGQDQGHDVVALLSRLTELTGSGAHRPGPCNALCTPWCHNG